MSILAGYLFVSHGAKHGGPLEELAGAQAQLQALNAHAARGGAEVRVVGHDYARKVSSLDDLPNLFRLLKHLQATSGNDPMPARIVIDDYTRLFRAATGEFQPALWDMLIQHADHITDLRQGKPLDAVSPDMVALIRTGLLPPLNKRAPSNKRSKRDKAAQTAKARHVSAVARSNAAQRSAKALKDAFDSYKAAIPRAGFREFMESDAASGLKNSRGDRWTYRSGLRALRLLEESPE